jgi:hypothetical protein
MMHAWPPLRELADGEYMGADTYLAILTERSNWLYGQAHGWNYPFLQGWGSGITQPVWQGETTVRTEHMTLRLGARLALNSGGTARLQYLRDDDTWVTLDSDTNTTVGRYFGGFNPYYERALTGLSPKGDIWRFRFVLEDAGGFALVYRAALAGTTGFATWPAPVTFADSPTVHTAIEFNTLHAAQSYLLDCARQPRTGSVVNSGHRASSSGALFRWSFRYGGTSRLIVKLKAMDGTVGQWGSVVLVKGAGGHPGDACWAPWSEGTEVELQALSGETLDATYSVNLSGESLTVGAYYGIELRADAGVTAHVLGLGFGDEASVVRTYTPVQTWTHGDVPTAAQMNTIANDLNQMHPTADRQSPLWLEHEIATTQLPLVVGNGPEHGLSYLGPVGFYLAHRWRWLRYRGAGKVMSLDETYEQSLSDSDPAGETQLFDLDSLSWLTYGQGYYVAVRNAYGEAPTLQAAYEDYDV